MAKPAPAEQPVLVAQSAPAAQPAPAEQPTLTAQPASAEQPTLVAQSAPVVEPASVSFQAAQIGSRLFPPSGPTIEPGVFSPRFSADLIFPNSNLLPGAYHSSRRHILSKLFQSKW
ncbi:hypothetical protein C1H46_000441 [Malus baccata]|uniref:Uncharacterized protein n=1 Tax=Malus baccata TaxID=106549 RepID=A0A540NTB2_MALBA|nr:hypothetical protein C1H46_000441 [Malus baccata]